MSILFQTISYIGLSLILNSVAVGTTFLTLTQQGYDNLLVQISDDIPSTNCQTVLNSLQVTLEEASSAVCQATKSVAFFKNITILIPTHWPNECVSSIDSSIVWPRPHLADIVLAQDHPVFGSQPLTLQYGGCGVSSLASRLPLSFLASGSTRGVSMAHEWFHFRYGVFDEIGVDRDPLYPAGYQITQSGAQILPTSCTNIPLKGEWVGSTWQNSVDNENITSSIMFTTTLTSIDQQCTKSSHMKAPPTKQNWICEGKSVSEIVYHHPDFLTYNQTKKCVEPHFNIVRNVHRGYHIILDVSSSMTTSADFLASAKFAVSHFVWFLPDGSTVSVDTFSDYYAQLQTPIVLNLTTKNSVLNRLSKLGPAKGNSDGLGAALNNAIRLFRSGLDIILITATETVPSGFTSLIDEFHRNLIAPHVLALNIRTTDILSDLVRNGWLYYIPKHSDVAVARSSSRNPQTWMVDTMQSIYRRSRNHRAKVDESTIELKTGWNNGTFQLDSAGNNLMFALYPLDDAIGVDFYKLLLYGPSGNEECFITRLNDVFMFAAKCEANKTFEVGDWSYAINVDGFGVARLDIWYEGIDLVQVESWTNSFQNNPIDWKSDRVIIYTQVTKNQRAISDVNPLVYLIGDDSSEIFSFALNEDNPSDITKGDGIYSAIVTNLPRNSTHFYYVIEAVDSLGTVDFGIYNRHPMAGSFIPLSLPTSLSNKFNRFVYGGSFRLGQPFDGRDTSPPGRVTDLSINDSYNSSVRLEWTGPKDNYGESSVLVERFIVTSESDIDSDREEVCFNGTVLPTAGSLDHMTLTVAVPVFNQSRNVYYRVYALDLSGNQAQSSNIVTLHVPATVLNPDDDPTLPPALFWFLIGLAIVCLIVIVVIVVFCVQRRRQRRKREDIGADWVQIGETIISQESKVPTSLEPQVPNFEAPLSPISRRLSTESCSSSGWSNAGYSVGSEVIYQEAQVFVTKALVNSSRNYGEEPNNSPVTQRSTFEEHKQLPIRILKFGDEKDSLPSSPVSTVISSPKKIPPRPPPRRNYPYSSDNQQRFQVDDSPLASSPSYLVSQLQKEDGSYPYYQALSKAYSLSALSTAASNGTMLSRYGIILGADSEASLV